MLTEKTGTDINTYLYDGNGNKIQKGHTTENAEDETATVTESYSYSLDEMLKSVEIGENISTYSVSGGKTVNRWLPGYKYTYTFNLLKTGINTVTCTVTNWQNVDVNGGNVTIE